VTSSLPQRFQPRNVHTSNRFETLSTPKRETRFSDLGTPGTVDPRPALPRGPVSMGAEVAPTTGLAATLVVPALVSVVAHQTGQPTIVGYLLTGLLLGPAVSGVVESSALTTTSERGLAFLLFLLGTEMRVEATRHVLRPVLRLSVPRMGLVSLTGPGTAALLGVPFWKALPVVICSSTAVGIEMLTDTDAVASLPGKVDVGVLPVQDVVVTR